MRHTLCQQATEAMYLSRMSLSCFQLSLGRATAGLLALCCLAVVPVELRAQPDKTPATAKPAEKPVEDKVALPPLPAEAHTQQAIMI